MKRVHFYACLILSIMFYAGCTSISVDRLVFPYSQWTVASGSHNISWHFQEGFDYNDSFIKAPRRSEWHQWYNKIVDYRTTVRHKAGKEMPYLSCEFPSKNDSRIHFDKFAYQLNLLPGEALEISAKSLSPETDFMLYVNFDLKTRGEEQSYVIREKREKTDSILIHSSKKWEPFSMSFKVPEFSSDRFASAPVITIKPVKEKAQIFLKDIHLQTAKTADRKTILTRIKRYMASQAGNNSFDIPSQLSWTHQNYVMGFVFIWDVTFWDPEKSQYTVDRYCQTMRNEFGGIQSVILWHSYPNIGIDDRNQFDMLRSMPGGMAALNQVVSDFHRNGIKVFMTYNPWDLDTRRPENHDFVELAQIISESGADGIFLDTWKSSKGSISIFEVEQSIRDEALKYGKHVAFVTEILPELKDLYGKDALTSSWGQEINPFHYTDVSHHKWLMPQHKQYYIKRMAKDKFPILSHAWINGQGIQLWENIFGTMNLWNAKDRQVLRKMNAIWHTCGSLYITDNWKPFIPLSAEHVVAGQWEKNGHIITNFVDTTRSVSTVRLKVQPDEAYRYFDLWQGKELKKIREKNKTFVELEINNFGCLLETENVNESLNSLLVAQVEESRKTLPDRDDYSRELSLKQPLTYIYQNKENSRFAAELLPLKGGDRTLTCQHIWREGQCYPNRDAKDNHDLVLSLEGGAQRINHTHIETFSPFAIMPRVVTNGQFEAFIQAAHYIPRFKENFLKHWGASTCPENIKNEPVVYVSLEDARAFAEWAGMQLPTEWEWQLAAETYRDAFKFNEVFELNESERFDGFNRSVSLRGGCSHWVTPSSWWYLPSAPYAEKAGGPQKVDSHVKYFLMYPGVDRASTIGFRCVKKQQAGCITHMHVISLQDAPLKGTASQPLSRPVPHLTRLIVRQSLPGNAPPPPAVSGACVEERT